MRLHGSIAATCMLVALSSSPALSQSDTAAWAPESSAGLLVSAETPASYPSVTVAGGRIVVGWTGEGATHSEIRVRRVVK